MAHTPWGLQDRRIVNSKGGTVALLTNPLHGEGEVLDWPRHGYETVSATAAHLSAEANATLIICAVNSHATLLAALELYLSRTKAQAAEHFGPDHVTIKGECHCRVCKQAHAAITNARG